MTRSLQNPLRVVFVATLLAAVCAFISAPALAENVWLKVAAGSSGMAMDDINDGSYSFYENSIDGYNFPDLNSGFSLSFHLGTHFSDSGALAFSWDNQHGHVSGTDVDVTANMKLDADLFMGHFYWIPVRKESFQLGGAAGLGFLSASGTVKVERDNVDYGEGDTSGSTWATEMMALGDYFLGENTSLQLTAGWRWAKVDDVKYQGAPALKDDGSNLALDYTGYIVKMGFVWRYSED